MPVYPILPNGIPLPRMINFRVWQQGTNPAQPSPAHRAPLAREFAPTYVVTCDQAIYRLIKKQYTTNLVTYRAAPSCVRRWLALALAPIRRRGLRAKHSGIFGLDIHSGHLVRGGEMHYCQYVTRSFSNEHGTCIAGWFTDLYVRATRDGCNRLMRLPGIYAAIRFE